MNLSAPLTLTVHELIPPTHTTWAYLFYSHYINLSLLLTLHELIPSTHITWTYPFYSHYMSVSLLLTVHKLISSTHTTWTYPFYSHYMNLSLLLILHKLIPSTHTINKLIHSIAHTTWYRQHMHSLIQLNYVLHWIYASHPHFWTYLNSISIFTI